MNKYILSCGSTADLTEEHFSSRDIHFICYHFELDGVSYLDDLGKTISYDDFYEKMKNGSETRTSQINTDEFEEFFKPFLDEGYDILHVSMSSGLSGVVNSAHLAARNLSEKYPNQKIYIVDSLCASSGYGLLMDKLADLRDSGMSIDKLRQWAEKNKDTIHHWFFSTDLSFYVKGGRISKTAGAIGNLMNICPVLNMDENGKLVVQAKIRGKKKVIKEIIRMMELHAQNGMDYHDKCYVSHSACPEDAREVAKLVEQKFPKLKGPVEINNIGTTIGCHSGPGTVAIFFWGDSRSA
ncbi:MAG: DegV family protein [Eubacterium sp.]|nr:DegV family protein [Eubacterium sp.]